MTSIEAECPRCHRKFYIKIVRDKKTGKKGPKRIFCRKCINQMNVSVDKKRKEDSNVRLVSEKVDYAKEVEALRRMENYNPALVERLRKESGKEKAA